MSEEKTKAKRSTVLRSQCFDEKKYEYDFSFKAGNVNDPLSVHTTVEMLECLERNKNVELDAKVMGIQEGQLVSKRISKEKFRESYVKSPWDQVKFKESSNAFATGFDPFPGVGNDFTPLLGGPFYKNLYYYQDYIRMHAEAFFAYHNDPVARAFTQITRDFVLGTGYEVQCDTNDRQGQVALAAWKAFEEANDFQEQIDQAVTETSIYGEIMFWELPSHQAKITYQLSGKDTDPKAIIPRLRIIDPSNIVEIITYPEDITRPLAYIWLTPTQYQIFTGGLNSDSSDSMPIQPTLKFIYRQIPAEQMHHFKINSVSNEKRGRSDYFPIFAYLKRLRDSVDYSLIGLQKASAWAIDTEIDGDQADIDAYVQAQAALGTIPQAGSEFVHTKAIKRIILAAQGKGGVASDAFSWSLSMACAGVGIPVSYLGTHLSGGSTRASALVSTEPVAKKMEKRREFIKRIIRRAWAIVMKQAGLPMIDCNIIFPEIITQDRSQKLKDLLLMQQSRWISPERAAAMAAKEIGIQNYSYQVELEKMKEELPEVPMPLTTPGAVSGDSEMQTSPFGSKDDNPDVSGLTSQNRKDIKSDDTNL